MTRLRHDSELRSAYLSEVLTALYPPPCSYGDEPTGATVVAEYRAIPDARRPRLLVPLRSRRVAATALLRYAQPPARLARLKRDLAALALRTGASSVLLRDRVRVTRPPGDAPLDTIDRYLIEALGRELSLSVHIGPTRANRKPVLQLLSPAGETIGFAKVGTTPLTRRLVRQETTALTTLGHLDLAAIRAPRVLHAGQWRGHEVLIQEALPSWSRRTPLLRAQVAGAMRELSGALGESTGSLAGSLYWKTLHGRLSELPGSPLAASRSSTKDGGRSRSEVLALGLAADEIVARAGGTELTYGTWHGDWAPWNMAPLPDRILLWDWERFTPGVPVGFDALHHDLQVRLERGADAGDALDETLRRGDRLLAPFGVTEPAAVRLTSLLYLVDLAVRYLADRQAEVGARLGVLGTWLLPALVRRVAHLGRQP